MPFDAHKNLAVSLVATAPSPPTSGTSLTVSAGEGARFPAAPFNATVWPSGANPTPANAEIVRVTAIAGDTLTLTRAQESTTARAIVAGDVFALTLTAKSMADLESGTNFPLISTPGDITGTAPITTVIKRANNNGEMYVLGGVDGGNGAYLGLFGATHATVPGTATLVAMGTGKLDLAAGGAARQRIHASGGVSFGDTVDPGGGHLSTIGNVILKATPTAYIHRADDTGNILILGGAGAASMLVLSGGGQGGGGTFAAGNMAGAGLTFQTTGVTRQKIHPSGGISFGSASDPGAGRYVFAGDVVTIGTGYGHATLFLNAASGYNTSLSYQVAGTAKWYNQVYQAGAFSMAWLGADANVKMTLDQSGNLDAIGTVTMRSLALRGATGTVELSADTLTSLLDRVAQLEARLTALESQP